MNLSMVQPPRIENRQEKQLTVSPGSHREVQMHSLCLNCRSPLSFSAVRCPDCGTRHAMADCFCCGGALFKHASVKVFQDSWQTLPPKGNLIHRLWIWIRSSRQKEIHYLHPQCVEQSEALLSDAAQVIEANASVWQVPETHGNRLSDDVQARTEVQPISRTQKYSGDMNRQAETTQASCLERQTPADESLSEENLSEETRFQSLFLETSPGYAELLHPYQQGQRNFSNAQLQGLSIEKQCLESIDLSHADVRRSLWQSVDLSTVDWSGAIADYASFIDSDLRGGSLRHISLRDGKVILSNLAQADCFQADLRRSDFYSSNFQHATLTGANLTQSKLDAVDLSFACLASATLVYASLMEATLKNSNCEQGDFSKANLSWANLENSCAIQANFSEAVLQCANLKGIDLSGAILWGTDFLGANIEQAKSLDGAQYDPLTRFPVGFNPEQWGMMART